MKTKLTLKDLDNHLFMECGISFDHVKISSILCENKGVNKNIDIRTSASLASAWIINIFLCLIFYPLLYKYQVKIMTLFKKNGITLSIFLQIMIISAITCGIGVLLFKNRFVLPWLLEKEEPVPLANFVSKESFEKHISSRQEAKFPCTRRTILPEHKNDDFAMLKLTKDDIIRLLSKEELYQHLLLMDINRASFLLDAIENGVNKPMLEADRKFMDIAKSLSETNNLEGNEKKLLKCFEDYRDKDDEYKANNEIQIPTDILSLSKTSQ